MPVIPLALHRTASTTGQQAESVIQTGLAISFGDNDRNRAAANSIARGIPFSRQQIRPRRQLPANVIPNSLT